MKRIFNMDTFNKWRKKLSPVIGVIVLGLFLYWMVRYRETILASFRSVGILPLTLLLVVMIVSLVLTVLALVLLVRGKGYSTFDFMDAYHALNLSQLASLIPGGIWGYAGFAGYLWSRGVSKVDSVIVIILNTLIMLTACAIVGFSSLISVLHPLFALISLLPFLLLVVGRNRLDILRGKYYPASSSLPSSSTLLKTLLVAIVVWMCMSFGFAGFVSAASGPQNISLWMIAGAYAAGYLAGYLAIFVPSGLGVSEGVVALILGPYMGTEQVLAASVSFRIIHTLVVWCNILISAILTSRSTDRGTDT
jgi:hypothetical protein